MSLLEMQKKVARKRELEVELKELSAKGYDTRNVRTNYSFIEGDTEYNIVVKSFRSSSKELKINPNEWLHLLKPNSKLMLYMGHMAFAVVDRKALLGNHDFLRLRISSTNFSVDGNKLEDSLERLANDIQYFERTHFVFERVHDSILSRANSLDDYGLFQSNSNQEYSAGNDEEVGNLIAEAMEKVGKDGVITIEESKTMKTELTTVEGMQFDRGYISPYFATDAEKGIAEYENCYVLCVNKTIGGMKEILPIIEQVAREGVPLLLIAEDVEGEALASLTINSMRKVLKIVVVKAPDFGIHRTNKLKDIAVLTGGKCAIDELNLKVENFSLDDLGKADKVVVTKDHTTIIVNERTEDLEKYVKVLQAQAVVEENTYEQDKIKERIAKLASGVAVIKVGALTEVEMKEKKLRIEDALNATKAAVKEGVVAGGGIALLRAYDLANDTEFDVNESIEKGYNIVYQSLLAPITQIVNNTGADAQEVIRTIHTHKGLTYGYDALNDRYVDMLEAGIIDPVKVTKSALLNATSIASMLLTTEAAIVKVPEKQELSLPNLI